MPWDIAKSGLTVWEGNASTKQRASAKQEGTLHYQRYQKAPFVGLSLYLAHSSKSMNPGALTSWLRLSRSATGSHQLPGLHRDVLPHMPASATHPGSSAPCPPGLSISWASSNYSSTILLRQPWHGLYLVLPTTYSHYSYCSRPWHDLLLNFL